jgi:tetratricopeptide (TPR) repeat protein
MSKRRREKMRGNRPRPPAGVETGKPASEPAGEFTAAFIDSIARNAADLWLRAERQGCREPMVLVIGQAAPASAAILEVCSAIRDVDGGLRVTKASLGGERGVDLYWVVAEADFVGRVLHFEDEVRGLRETKKRSGISRVLSCTFLPRADLLTITYGVDDALKWEPNPALSPMTVLHEVATRSDGTPGRTGGPSGTKQTARGGCSACGNEAPRFAYGMMPISFSMEIDQTNCDLLSEVRMGPSPLVRFRTGFPVKPDVALKFGNIYCYWVNRQGAGHAALCSRNCAVAYAARNRVIMIDETRVITPQTAQFDAYAREHGLKAYLATTQEDHWQSEQEELTSLLEAILPTPDRLFSLTAAVIQKGHTKLAACALDVIANRYPLGEVIGEVSLLLSQLDNFARIDELYEQLLRGVRTHEQLGWQTLSTWAFGILGYRPEKAKLLSELAVKYSRAERMAVENHLCILSVTAGQQDQLAFLEQHTHQVKSHPGNLTAGQVYLSAGQYAKALDHLLVADAYLEEPMTKQHLAETYLRLGMLPQAGACINWGLEHLEGYQGAVYTEFDGSSRGELGFTYQEKRHLRKCFLVMEGMLLKDLGEEAGALNRLRDALAIDSGVQERIFAEAEALVGEVESPTVTLPRSRFSALQSVQRGSTAAGPRW